VLDRCLFDDASTLLRKTGTFAEQSAL